MNFLDTLTDEQKAVHEFQIKNFDHDSYLAAQVDPDDDDDSDRTANDYMDFSYSSIEE